MTLSKRLAGLLKSSQLSLFREIEPPAATPATPAAPRPRSLLLGGQAVGYELRRARRRSIGFTVSAEGLKVSAPRWVGLAEIETALRGKQDWILRKLEEQQDRARRQHAAQVLWGEGGQLPYLGQVLTLRLGGLARYEPASRELHLGLPTEADPAQVREAALAWLAGRARALFEQRCRHYAAALSVRYTRLSLSSAQTRWGSASASGAIRLSWRLILLAPELIDYVVAHEMAHLHEMNHSPRFWAVVASVMPDYESARQRLREVALPTLEL